MVHSSFTTIALVVLLTIQSTDGFTVQNERVSSSNSALRMAVTSTPPSVDQSMVMPSTPISALSQLSASNLPTQQELARKVMSQNVNTLSKVASGSGILISDNDDSSSNEASEKIEALKEKIKALEEEKKKDTANMKILANRVQKDSAKIQSLEDEKQKDADKIKALAEENKANADKIKVLEEDTQKDADKMRTLEAEKKKDDEKLGALEEGRKKDAQYMQNMKEKVQQYEKKIQDADRGLIEENEEIRKLELTYIKNLEKTQEQWSFEDLKTTLSSLDSRLTKLRKEVKPDSKPSFFQKFVAKMNRLSAEMDRDLLIDTILGVNSELLELEGVKREMMMSQSPEV